MFGRYAVAAGRGPHRHALGERAAALGLPVRMECGELLLVGTADAILLRDAHAIVVGQVFDRSGRRLSSLPAALRRLGEGADPRSALTRHWGNYAFFFASNERAIVYREPSASVPVYRFGNEGQTIFISDAELFARLGLFGPPRIDRLFLVHWLQFPFLRNSRTGLEGVTELIPGSVLERCGSDKWIESAAWRPSRFIRRSQALDDPDEAARRLRATALSVVAAQADSTRIVLRLSGGLDSSIIAACLAQAGLQFECINFATRARDGDERVYAREVAASFGAELVEVREPDRPRLELPHRRSFRPRVNPLLEPFERAVGQAADRLGATLLIDGGGGDNLFCSIASSAPVIDALASGKPGIARKAIVDIALRADCTVWEVLAAAARRVLRRKPAWREDRSFLRPEAALRTCDLHPWLEGLAAPPGKREHVEALVHIQHFLDRSSSSVGMLHPLLAQPLLELCLRIPSWLWVRGGRDRAVAREAFAGLVPSSVLERRMKGSLQSLLYRSFRELRAEMRELLLSGELAAAGIIDTEAVDRALMTEGWKADAVQLRISEMIALELWCRSWSARPAFSTGF